MRVCCINCIIFISIYRMTEGNKIFEEVFYSDLYRENLLILNTPTVLLKIVPALIYSAVSYFSPLLEEWVMLRI